MLEIQDQGFKMFKTCHLGIKVKDLRMKIWALRNELRIRAWNIHGIKVFY